MERPPQQRALGPTPILSVLTAPAPSSGIASTIYVSPEAASQHHQFRQPHTLVHSDSGGGAPLRRGPKRAARGEVGVADESSPAIWVSASNTPVNADRTGTNGHGPSPGLGVSPDDDRDSSSASPSATATTDQPRKKQKRNKPTLSCFECVERKTKVCETTRSATNGRRMTRPPKKRSDSLSHSMPNAADRGLNVGRLKALGSVATSTGLLSNVPFSSPGASNVFGIGSEHPFANYWTCEGGLPEVISVLPDKLQADILLNRYFECVDPVYPMLHRQTFYADYEHFWSLSRPEKDRADAAFVALIFVMLALGTQFVTSTSPKERKQTAEFYASASNQALLVPDAPPFEKQQRRKVWQAVLLQDTFLTVLLSLPPSATHTDVSVEDLVEDDSSIASDDPTDTAYIRGSWTLANLVQETICSPRSLDVPICTTARHKSKLIGDFRAVYRSFPDVFRSWDPDALAQLAQSNKRVVRQTLFLSSNYFHNLMLVHASESQDVPVNARGTLEAAHDAITAFFVLFALFEAEARVWWVFNHRAFLEALCIGNVLREVAREPGGEESMAKDPLFIMQVMSEGDHGSNTARTRVQVLSEFLI
ncbi:hypothetical protein F5144DRAFT_592598 [Chaetomium tenue]|uniref:Uncharacterized protein n=1 Tax=Chaetomium tenue TaxID=1854479 RepID=A0ACB7PBR6_9PEZI|nr:hypothetical protein F5144DRAFT_592598 [Chaetomium globosum]